MALWRRKYYNSINLYAQHICHSMSISPLVHLLISLFNFLALLESLHFHSSQSISFYCTFSYYFLLFFSFSNTLSLSLSFLLSFFIDLWEAKHLQLIGVSMLLLTMMISSTPLIFFHSHQGHIHDIYCIIDGVACNICRSEYMYNIF